MTPQYKDNFPRKAIHPLIRIKHAAIRGKSVMLKPHECYQLYFQDTAVKDAADNIELDEQNETKK